MARTDPESADRGMTSQKRKEANEILAISTKKCSSKEKKEKPHLGGARHAGSRGVDL